MQTRSSLVISNNVLWIQEQVIDPCVITLYLSHTSSAVCAILHPQGLFICPVQHFLTWQVFARGLSWQREKVYNVWGEFNWECFSKLGSQPQDLHAAKFGSNRSKWFSSTCLEVKRTFSGSCTYSSAFPPPVHPIKGLLTSSGVLVFHSDWLAPKQTSLSTFSWHDADVA